MNKADETGADAGTDGTRDRRARRADLLAAVVRAFPVEPKLPYGAGAVRFEAVYRDRSLDLLQSLLSGRMASAMRRWSDMLEKAVKRHGIGLKQWQALFILAVNNPGETLTSIAARLGVPSATLVRILHDLEAAGLIERQVDANDRRAKLLDLTPQGEKTFVTLFDINCALRRQFLDGVSESEILLMVEAADMMDANLDRMAAEE